MKHFRVRKKSSYGLFDAYNHYRNWMFLDQNFTQIEILSPTLNNLEMMQQYGLTTVVKGFRNIWEYSMWDRLRFKFGMASVRLITTCLGTDFMMDAIESFANGEPLPNPDIQEIENSHYISVSCDKDEKRVLDRDKNLREYYKYSFLIHREMQKLKKHGRVEKLTLLH